MEGWEAHFARYPPGFLQAEMVARLIIELRGMFEEVDFEEMMAVLCPWTAEPGVVSKKAKRRDAVLALAKADATRAAFENWKKQKKTGAG